MRKLVCVLLAFFLFAAGHAAFRSQEAIAMVATHQRTAARRLPATTTPVLYDIALRTDLPRATFSGTETITVRIDKSTHEIQLHALELKITNPSLTDSAGKHHLITTKWMPAEEMLTFRANDELPAGEYKLRTAFSGRLSDKLIGFYKANFVDRSGKTQMLAATQFEPADARRMIPCFDEPAMKAKFRLSVDIDSKFSAVSNAAVEKEVIHGNLKTVQFATSPPMSSYLLALVVGELQATPPVISEGVPIRVWSVKGMSHLGTYSRDEAAKILPFLNHYFGISYPWKKLDLIAVPEFAAGAMENPGAITFRENLLLLDPKRASTNSQKSATSVIAHEMAHLWFGDLVTMKWWDDLWLNEAFATWMSTKAVNAVRPEWQMWKGYATDRTGGLATDSLQSTRAIHADVKSPEQSHEMFDVITYDKGAAVLRMLEQYVSESAFEKGVQLYLKAHAFANATTADLWDGIGAASGLPVKDIMHNWVRTAGNPILTVSETDRPAQIGMSQKRFFQLAEHHADNQSWSVPIGLRFLNHPVDQNQQTPPQRKYLLADLTGEVPMPVQPIATGENIRPDQFAVLANAGGVGYFRVKYSDQLLKNIIAQPRDNFDPSERLSLVDDSSAMMVSGALPVDRHLDLIASYKDETDEMVWRSILDDLYWLDRFVDEPSRKSFQQFIRAELASIYARVGWDPKPTDTPQTRQLRSAVIGALGTIGQDPKVIAEARSRFAVYLKDKAKLDRDLIQPVSTVVAYNGSEAQYEQFRNLSLKAATPEERVRSLWMLPEFQSPALVDRTLNYALSKQVRLQDAPGLIGGILSRRQMQDQGWQFVTTNWQRIRSIFPEDMVPHLVSSAGSFTREAQLTNLTAFIAAHPVPSGKSASQRAIETSKINVQFRKRSGADLNKWLQSHYTV